ncbi:hypothetical protein A4X03_0g8887 [Tilletia caries]|uniref:Uncharacterized protein n=3 Tax=Tilletia TaxID=13289 RepID=A0A177TUV9_9BASI|nr:hypothetical protein CF335_g8896 [Tilletia laevis]KAE8238254.1 hypothetical protein A4X03_0g8887 [Tilletia caries]
MNNDVISTKLSKFNELRIPDSVKPFGLPKTNTPEYSSAYTPRGHITDIHIDSVYEATIVTTLFGRKILLQWPLSITNLQLLKSFHWGSGDWRRFALYQLLQDIKITLCDHGTVEYLPTGALHTVIALYNFAMVAYGLAHHDMLPEVQRVSKWELDLAFDFSKKSDPEGGILSIKASHENDIQIWNKLINKPLMRRMALKTQLHKEFLRLNNPDTAPSKSVIGDLLNLAIVDCKPRFPTTSSLQKPKDIFRSDTDWTWIFNQFQLDTTIETFNLDTRRKYLTTAGKFDIWAENFFDIFSTGMFLLSTGVSSVRNYGLHVLRAGTILAPIDRDIRFAIQGTILVLEWGTLARDIGYGRWTSSESMAYLSTVSDCKAQILITEYRQPRAQAYPRRPFPHSCGSRDLRFPDERNGGGLSRRSISSISV